MKSPKGNLLDEIQYDLKFLKLHTLQPRWYKIAKVFILFGFLVGYALLFGLQKTLLFLAFFVILCAVMHMVYRIKTHKYTQSWLDFVIYQEQGETKMKRIGKFYYPAILVIALISVIVSQLWG